MGKKYFSKKLKHEIGTKFQDSIEIFNLAKKSELFGYFSQGKGCRKLLGRAHPVFGDLN